MIDLKEYIKAPDECPHCHSKNITTTETNFSYVNAWRDVVCKDCKKEWQEEFTITGVTEYDKKGMPI